MKTVNVNAISRKYEQLHKKYEKISMKDERFYAINNAMIFSYFSILKGFNYDGNNLREVYSAIEETYGMSLFFYNVKKTSMYKQILAESIDIFYELFDSGFQSVVPLETLLGNVLEKHINQKDTGSYYTPGDTTEYISMNAILISVINKCSDNIQEKIKTKFKIDNISRLLNLCQDTEQILTKIVICLSLKEKQDFIYQVYHVKIIDPTCGSGAFIIKALECMEKILVIFGENEIKYNQLLYCLYGVDISKEAIQLTKVRLIMRIADKNCNMNDFNAMYNKNFVVADALKGSDYFIQETGFDWTSFGTKFDCIIGNPPYVEMRGYVSDEFYTKKCGNLYAYTVERACNIANEGAIVSFIVPLPFIATPRMEKAKEYIESRSENIYYSTFADRPGCIFTGVHQRLTIFFAEIGESTNITRYSSTYNYWYNEERKDLYNNISFINNPYEGILPKVGNEIELNIYMKLVSHQNHIEDIICKESEYPIYLSTRIGFWTKAFMDNVFSSKEYKEYYARSSNERYLFTAILNSSTFYFLWVILSDCWHITNKNLQDITFDLRHLDEINMEMLADVCNRLMDDLEKNKKYIGSKQTEYEYKHKYSKTIIDQIDDMLAPIFGLDERELEYVKRYTEKYRVNTVEE